VINAVLDESDNGMFDVFDKPNCDSRDGASRYSVEITNENYLTLMQTYPANSSKISLRRLLYWFVENEIYNECGWTFNNILRRQVDSKIVKKIKDLQTAVTKIQPLVADNYEALMSLTSINNELDNLFKIYKE
jgi:hypothetical protein